MNMIKRLFTVITTAASLTVGFEASGAVPLSGNAPVVNSTASTNQVVNFPYWPVVVAGGTSVTNFTKIDISGKENVALQFQCQSTNTTTTSNVVWAVYKNIAGQTATNAVGTNVRYDTLGFVTNVLNGVTPVVTVATYTPLGKAATTSQSSDNGIAGVTTLYIGNVTTLGLSGLTNYQVYQSSYPLK
jgi:hypothetical protein